MSVPFSRKKACVLIHRASVLTENEEKPEEALPLLQRATVIAPDWWETWGRLGSALSNLLRYDEAMEACEKALGLVSKKRDKFVVLFLKASVLLRMGRNAETLEVANQGLTLRDHPLLMDIKGVALLRLGRPAEALDAYERSVASSKTFYPGWVGQGIALIALQRYEEAIAALDMAIHISPQLNEEAWYEKAVALARLARYPEALAAVDTALKEEPDYPEAKVLRQRLVKKAAADRQRGRDHRHGRLDDSHRDR